MSSSPRPQLTLKARIMRAFISVVSDMVMRSNTLRRKLLAFEPKVPANSQPVNGVSSFDIQIDASRNLWFRLYKPVNAAQDDTGLPLLIYFHGGGFSLGSVTSNMFDLLCRKFAGQIHAVVISVEYRLAPEYKCPIAYEDGMEALKFIDTMDFQTGPMSLKVDLGRCFISGDSAGGNLAHHVVVKANGHAFHNIRIKGMVAIMPFFGGEERTESEIRNGAGPVITLKATDWFWKNFLPDGSDRNHPAANIFGPNAPDLTGVKYPSTIIFVGGLDPLVDWQKKYYEGLKKLGVKVEMVEYPDMVHGFYALFEYPEAALMVNEIKEFVQKQSLLQN